MMKTVLRFTILCSLLGAFNACKKEVQAIDPCDSGCAPPRLSFVKEYLQFVLKDSTDSPILLKETDTLVFRAESSDKNDIRLRVVNDTAFECDYHPYYELRGLPNQINKVVYFLEHPYGQSVKLEFGIYHRRTECCSYPSIKTIVLSDSTILFKASDTISESIGLVNTSYYAIGL